MSELAETHVVTCFLRHGGEVLLLRRSGEVGSYRGRWGGVAGHVENDDVEGSAWREIAEETGSREGLELARRGEPFAVEDEELGKRWIVHPFLVDVSSRDVQLDWESVEAEWVAPTEILDRDVVPDLWRSYSRVRPTVKSIRDDREHGAAYIALRALEVVRDRAGELAREPERDPDEAWRELVALAKEVSSARPSMVVLANRVNRLMSAAKPERAPSEVERAARHVLAGALEADEKASAAASELVRGGRVLTLSRSASVVRTLLGAEPALVLVAESGPQREGVSTAERLARSGIPVALAADSAIADTAERLSISVALVGADAVLPGGGIVNKTGTRMVALVARERGVPFYAVAAVDKLAVDEQVGLERGDPRDVYRGDADIEVDNRLFEITPPELVSGIVTERGILSPGELSGLVEELRSLRDWD